MATRWSIRPEVAGGLGEDSEMDASVHPPKITQLHYEFYGWLGDDLIESFPVFLITARLAQALRSSDLTGWQLAPVKVTTSGEFEDLHPGRRLPTFFWLQVGRDRAADVSISAEHRLDVSQRALNLLRQFQIDNAIVEPTA